MRKWLAVMGLVFLFGVAACQAPQTRALNVTDAWARPASTGGTSAIYFNIDNPGNTADALLSAEAGVSQMVELHMSSMGEGGVMTMQEQERVEVPAGTLVEFKPGGLHVMLINLTEDLSPDDTFQVTLTFENAGRMTVDVPVRAP